MRWKPVRHDHQLVEMDGETIGLKDVRGEKEGEAIPLTAPERRVLQELPGRLQNRLRRRPVAQLLPGLFGLAKGVLKPDLILLGLASGAIGRNVQ